MADGTTRDDLRQVLDDLRDGNASLREVFEAAETDTSLGDMPVLEAIDAVVAGRTAQVLLLTERMQDLVEDLRLPPMASVHDLRDEQRETLMQTFRVQLAGITAARISRILRAGGGKISVRAASKEPMARPELVAAMTAEEFGERGVAYRLIAAQAADAHEQLVKALQAGAPRSAHFMIRGAQSAGKSSARRAPGGDNADVQADRVHGAGNNVEIKIFDGVVEVRKTGVGAAPGVEPAEPTRRDLMGAVAVLAEAQLSLLAELDSATVMSGRPSVSLQSPTGSIDYQMPIGMEDTYSPAQVGELLSPSGKGHRSLAQNRRRSNKLLAIQIDGQQYRYPKFQIDEAHHTIRPVAAYANQLLEASQDPWGVLDWWYSEDEGLDDRRPVEMLESGELTEELVDLAVGLSRQAMD